MRETSLEEFLETDAEADSDSVETAVSTYASNPSGSECPACGSVVERRWKDGDELVCADCKSW